MTPEQRKRLENNWLPLMAMDPSDRDALKSDDGPWHLLGHTGKWIELNVPGWSDGHVYRLAPQPKRKTVGQWQFIHKDVVAVAMCETGLFATFAGTPYAHYTQGCWSGNGKYTVPSEFVGPGLLIDPGDLTAHAWKESLIIRPGYGEK